MERYKQELDLFIKIFFLDEMDLKQMDMDEGLVGDYLITSVDGTDIRYKQRTAQEFHPLKHKIHQWMNVLLYYSGSKGQNVCLYDAITLHSRLAEERLQGDTRQLENILDLLPTLGYNNIKEPEEEKYTFKEIRSITKGLLSRKFGVHILGGETLKKRDVYIEPDCSGHNHCIVTGKRVKCKWFGMNVAQAQIVLERVYARVTSPTFGCHATYKEKIFQRLKDRLTPAIKYTRFMSMLRPRQEGFIMEFEINEEINVNGKRFREHDFEDEEERSKKKQSTEKQLFVKYITQIQRRYETWDTEIPKFYDDLPQQNVVKVLRADDFFSEKTEVCVANYTS